MGKKILMPLIVIIAVLLLFIACKESSADPDSDMTSDSDKSITTFTFTGLTGTVTATITGTDIEVIVPYETDPNALTPSITLPYGSISPASGVVQDFSIPVIYTVTAIDGTTMDYTVTVTIKSYVIGETGPGGGIIFYDDTIGYDFDGIGGIEADERDLMVDKRYLEVAPNTWNGGTEDPKVEWGDTGTDIAALVNIGDPSPPLPDTLAGTVGDGADNTAAIVSHMAGKGITGTAAQLCDVYAGGSQIDWFMPSVGELKILWSERDTVGGLSESYHLSSSEHSSSWARGMIFNSTGYIFRLAKDDIDFPTRAIRDF